MKNGLLTRGLIGLGIALCLCTSPAAAQDAKAKSILESASKKMSGLKSLKSAFSLKMIAKNGKTGLAKKGSFAMRGTSYHITLPEQEIICDGKTVWTWMKDAKEVQVSTYNPEEQALSPAKLFTNFYDKEYSYRYLGTRKVAGKTCNIIEMTPTAANKQFSKAELAIDNSNTIAGGNIFEKNGAQYQYEVSSVQANVALSNTVFSFDARAHPGIEVVDLR